MAKKPNPNDAPEDELPEGAPDQSFDEKEKDAPKAEAPAAEAEAEEPEKEEKVRPVHSKRQEVYKRLKAKREEEEGAEEGTEQRPSPYAAEPEPRAEEAPAPEEEAPAPEPKKVKLKINHQEVEKTEPEVIAAAQQHFAASDELSEAKRLRGDMQNMLAEIRSFANNAQRSDASAHQADGGAAEPEPGAPTKATGLDPKRVRDVFEKIRLGDGDEGVEEFSSLLSERQAAEPSFSREEIVADAVQIMRRQAAMEAASQEFQGRHPEVFSDVRLSRLATIELADLCLDEFRQLGVSQQDMSYLMQHPSEAINFHKRWREEGWQLSSAEEIAEKAIANVQAYRPAPAQNQAPRIQNTTRTEARTQEKRTDLQNQPRRASAVARQAPQQTKTTPEVVSGIRAMRGFRSN